MRKKERKKKKETTGQKYNGLPHYIGGHKKLSKLTHICQSYTKTRNVGQWST